MMQQRMVMGLERARTRLGLRNMPPERAANARRAWRVSVAMTNPKYFINQKRWQRHRKEMQDAMANRWSYRTVEHHNHFNSSRLRDVLAIISIILIIFLVLFAASYNYIFSDYLETIPPTGTVPVCPVSDIKPAYGNVNCTTTTNGSVERSQCTVRCSYGIEAEVLQYLDTQGAGNDTFVVKCSDYMTWTIIKSGINSICKSPS